MLRISQGDARDDEGPIHLRLEGQITGPWVDELRRVCSDTSGNKTHGKRHLVIDLAGVSFLDAAGIALFHELAARRVQFTKCSAFVAEQLKGVTDVQR
jgi:anti-anti-sigma regulatory factor